MTASLHCPYCGRPGATIVRHMASCDDCRRASTVLTRKIDETRAKLADLEREWSVTHTTRFYVDGKEER